MIKWILRFIVFILVCVFASALYIEFNKDKLVRQAVDAINQSLITPLDYQSSDVTFLSSLPYIGIELNNILIHDGSAKEPALLTLEMMAIRLNIVHALSSNGANEIEKIIMKNGALNLIERSDGGNNYMITANPTTQGSAPVAVVLHKYEIEQVDIAHNDLKQLSYNRIKGLSASGTISYMDDEIDLGIDLSAVLNLGAFNDHINLQSQGMIHLVEEYSVMTLDDLQVTLNDLPISVNGSLSLDKLQYDLSFDSPETDVKRIASLMNVIYANQYEKLRSSGTYQLRGTMTGYSSWDYPKYDISLIVADGSIDYPNLPQRIDKINMNISLKNEAGNTSFSEVYITDLHLQSADSYITGSGLVENMGTGYKIDLTSKMDIDFDSFGRALQLPSEDRLSGRGSYDVKINTGLDESLGIMGGENPIFSVNGQFDKIKYTTSESDYQIERGIIDGNQEELLLQVSGLHWAGYKGVNAEIHLKEPLSLAHFDDQTDGKAVIDIDEIIMPLSDTNVSLVEYNDYSIPSVNMETDISVKSITYGEYLIKDIEAKGLLTDDRSTINIEIESLNGNPLQIHGDLNGLIQYGVNNDTLSGMLDISSPRMDLNSLMSESDDEMAMTSLLPTNLDLEINYDFPQLSFYKVDISKALGNMSLEDGTLVFSQDADILDGHITFKGSYDDYINDTAAVELNIDLNAVSFKSTASQLGFFNKLIPFSQYLEGDYSGTLQWKSKIDHNYLPDLNSLSAFGQIQTQNGAINGFAPIDTFLTFIKSPVKDQRWALDNFERYFLIEDGKVIIKQIDLQKGDIQLSYSGSHSIDQDLNYQVTMSLPKSLLQIDQVMNVISKVGRLSEKLQGFGDDVIVNIEAHLSGKLGRPKLSLKDISLSNNGVTESIKDAIIETVEDKKQELETTIEDTLNYIKTTVVNSIDSLKDQVLVQKDSVQDILEGQFDSSKIEVAEQVEDIIDSLKIGSIDSLPGALEDIFKGQKDRISELKDKIKIDIFKKKKGN